MKKKIFFLLLLAIVLALCLCACDKNLPEDGTKNPNPDGWSVINDPNETDVYTKFLGGFTYLTQPYTKKELNMSPRISADATMKMVVNGNEFWATLKMNYNHKDQKNVMAAFELTSEKDNLGDVVLGLYVYTEKLYITFGQTKFVLDFKTDAWQSIFPFDLSMPSPSELSKMAMLMSSTIVTSEETTGKYRKTTIEEYNYVVNLNVKKSLAKLLDNMIKNGLIDKDSEAVYDMIFQNVFGVSLKEVLEGDFPDSSFMMDFTVSDKKISAFNCELNTDRNNADSIFPGDKLNISLNLVEFKSNKSNVGIPFVNDGNREERDRYVYYANNAFQVKLQMQKLSAGKKTPYELLMTAKVLQSENKNNWAFLELKNKQTNTVENALYIHQDFAYFYENVEGENICSLKIPIDLSDLANKVINNDFGQPSSMDWLSFISFFIGSIQLDDDALTFEYSQKFFEKVWFNFYPMLNYIDGQFEENLSEIPVIKHFNENILHSNYLVSCRFDTAFLSVIADSDVYITHTLAMLSTAKPQKELTKLPIVPMLSIRKN